MAAKLRIHNDKALARFIGDYLIPSRHHFAVDPIGSARTGAIVTVYEIEPHELEKKIEDVDLTDVNLYPSPLTRV